MVRARISSEMCKRASHIKTFHLEIYDEDGKELDFRKRIAYLDLRLLHLIKVVDPDKHYFRKYEGYAISKALIDQLEEKKHTPEKVIIIEKEDGRPRNWFEALFITWQRDGETVQYEDFEMQVALPLEKMTKDNSKLSDGGLI